MNYFAQLNRRKYLKELLEPQYANENFLCTGHAAAMLYNLFNRWFLDFPSMTEEGQYSKILPLPWQNAM